MRLKAFKVEMYRPILDSGWIDVGDITTIVGKNESGKTALLKALHKFNPFNPEEYSLDREWPRGRRKSRSLEKEVVFTRFEFDEDEARGISELISEFESPTGVEIAKLYNGDYKYKFLPETYEFPNVVPEDVATLLEELDQGEEISVDFKVVLSQIREQAVELLETSGLVALGESIQGYQSSIESFVNDTTEQDGIDADAAKDVLNQLSRLAGIEELPGKLEELVGGWLPTFIYMDDHKPFRGSAYLNQINERQNNDQLTDEDKTFLMILELAGLDFASEYEHAGTDDREQRMLDMNDASLSLTSLLADHWTQREYEIDFRADGYHIIAFVKDEVQPVLVPLEERSKGFQWFFSFDTTFLYETEGTFRNAIILLDEPGLHLHAAAQRDLLIRLRKYAEGNQLIYTTHLPFMIDMERLNDIRICIESKEEGTTVTSDFYSADEHSRFPLQVALGLSISQSLFVGQYNLVVEGVTDFWLLSTMATIFRAESLGSLDERIVITPAGAATKAAYVATMLHGQQLNVVVLLDSDPEGERVAEGLIKEWIVNDRHVLLIGQIIGREVQTTLEDIFPEEFYLTFVNDAYSKELKGSDITADELVSINRPQLVQRVNEAFKARAMPVNSEGKSFNKGRVAKLMLGELAKTTAEDLPTEVVENFRRLFEKVNSAMPGLE